MAAGHPKNKFVKKVDASAVRLINNLFEGGQDRKTQREEILSKWQARKEALANKEEEVKASLDPIVALVLSGKSTELEDELF